MQRYVVPVVVDGDHAVTHAMLLRRKGDGGEAWDVVRMGDDDERARRQQQVLANPQAVAMRSLEAATVVLGVRDGRKVQSHALHVTSEGGVHACMYLVTITRLEAAMVQRAMTAAARSDSKWRGAQLFPVRVPAGVGGRDARFSKRGLDIAPAARTVLLHLGVPVTKL